MLVLTRKYQEKIRIGDNITITVLRTKGKAVRLGIEAPANVPVIRGELKFETEELGQELALAGPAAAGRPNRPRTAAAETTWTTRVRGANSRPHSRPEAEIEHRRIPRGNVGQVLPRLISGNGALRELLDQRAGTL
jgi:carbon storage regulator